MALTTPRWLILALTGVVIAFLMLTAEPKEPSDEGREIGRLRQTENLYQRRLQVLEARLTVRKRIDSLRAVLGRQPAADIRVVYAASLPADVRAAAESLLTRVIRNASGPSKAGVDIAVLHVARDQGGPTLSYVLPQGAGDRCLVIIPISLSDSRYFNVKRIMRTEAAADQVLGPCAYLRAFGPPGPKIREWLDRRGWLFAGDGSWTTDGGWQLALAREYASSTMRVAWFLSPSASDCLSGALTTCESTFLTGTPYQTFRHQNVLVQPYVRLGMEGNFRGARLGPREAVLLADMVRLFGRDRFASFWRSGADVPDAFREATGKPIGPWVSEWMISQYGRVDRRPVAVSTYATTMAFLIVMLTAFVGIRIAANRQFA